MSKQTNTSIFSNTTFDTLQLDDILLDLLKKLHFQHPTKIQTQFIPLALQGRDIIAQSQTGSGKTLAYILPILQRVVTETKTPGKIYAVIIVPRQELCHQIAAVLNDIRQKSVLFNAVNLASQTSFDKIKNIDIIITTPALLRQFVVKTGIRLDTVEVVVFDEADCMFFNQQKQDTEQLHSIIPRRIQKWLLSATINETTLYIEKLFLHNPQHITIKDTSTDNIDEFYIDVSNQTEKALHLLTILKNNQNKRYLVFTNTIQSSLFVKIFLDEFSIASVLLNSDIPNEVRLHILDQFNTRKVNILVATDEATDTQTVSNTFVAEKEKVTQQINEETSHNYGVSRGIDFMHVDVVINFDAPPSVDNYVHRIGRTGRKKSGSAVTFLLSAQKRLLERRPVITQFQQDEKTFIDFRYRASDIVSSITKNKIKEARSVYYKQQLENEKTLSENVKNPKITYTVPIFKVGDKGLTHVPNYSKLGEWKTEKQIVNHKPGKEKERKKEKVKEKQSWSKKKSHTHRN